MPSSSSSSARDAERKALGDFNARSSFNKELNQLKVSRGEMDDLRRKLKDSERAREKMQREFSERLAAVEQTMRSGANPGAESRLLRLEARVDDALEKLEGKANRASVASALHRKASKEGVAADVARLAASVEAAVASATAAREATERAAAERAEAVEAESGGRSAFREIMVRRVDALESAVEANPW